MSLNLRPHISAAAVVLNHPIYGANNPIWINQLWNRMGKVETEKDLQGAFTAAAELKSIHDGSRIMKYGMGLCSALALGSALVLSHPFAKLALTPPTALFFVMARDSRRLQQLTQPMANSLAFKTSLTLT